MIQIKLNPPALNVTFNKKVNPKRPVVANEDHKVHIDLTGDKLFGGNRFNAMNLVIPKGYRSDLTSWTRKLGWYLLILSPLSYLIPYLPFVLLGIAIFALLLRDPFGDCQYAALVHDWCYEIKIPKPLADAIYLAMMDRLEVHPLRKWCHYLGVRWFGGPAYWNWCQKKRKLRKEKEKLARIKKRNLDLIRQDKDRGKPNKGFPK